MRRGNLSIIHIMLHLKDKYKKEVIPKMMEKFGYKNPMAVPKITKMVVNSGFGKQLTGKSSSEKEKIIKIISDILALIIGQKPGLRKAKKSIAGFKLREKMPVGLQITLRGKRMYDFLERLIWVVLPRTRDFRGISLKSFDKQGNLTIGVKEYTSFSEVVAEKEKGIFGLEMTIVNNAKTKEEAIQLFRLLGIPLKKESEKEKL